MHSKASLIDNAASLYTDSQAAVRAYAAGGSIDAAAAAAFGADISGEAVAAAVRAFDRYGWARLELVDEELLHGARGAYDRESDTIYVSRQFLAVSRDAPAAVTAVLIEEIGHAIDAHVHAVDAPGDEGAIFAQFVLGDAPDAAALAALHAENDHTTIVVDGVAAAVELAGPVVGTITLDGALTDWSATNAIDKPDSTSTTNYNIYGKATGGSFVFALEAPVAIGANTTVWLNTDQNVTTGYRIFGEAGGAEYNVNFDATGTPHLYTGNAGATLVPNVTVSFGYSADKHVVEFAVPTTALGSPRIAGTLWDVNDGATLPGNYWGPQYDVIDSSSLPVRTDFTKKIGIVFSDTSAAKYFDKTAYSQLFMAAQNQAAMAGVHYDILTETDLTNLSKLVNYDALLFPNFTNVQSGQLSAIETNLKLAVEHYKIGLIASGDFMTNNQTGAALPVDPYERMKALFDLQPVNGGFPADVTVRAGDITHSIMQDYTANEVIHTYTAAGWLAYQPIDPAGTAVLATQTVGGQTYDAVVATTPGGRNVHFSTDEVMADNNLLWQAIDYAVNGSGVTAGLQLSRNASIVAARNDMDQAMERLDVDPESGAPGIYDKLMPILQQWKSQYNFVGSYYIDIGANPPDQQTLWAQSGVYYKQLLDMGNELGSHSVTHPENTNLLTAAQIQSEFLGSKQTIEQQMSQFLGQPFTVTGAAVPGASETLATALQIIQYYDYLSGGFSGVGAGFPGAFGYLNPAMAAADKVYLAPNVQFDFTLVEFKGMTPAQASAEWQREWNELTAHADVPILLWPWHDYAGAAWATNPPAASPYTTAMFTQFISQAYAAGAEFVTLTDLADRISAFNDTSVTTSVNGNTVTATVTSPAAGKFALDLDNLIGTQKIASVNGWYAYDNDSVFLDRDGGSYTINLGSTAADVTHITALPMRAELVSLSGDGTNLSFSVIGEGRIVIDLVNPAGRQAVVTGATVVSLAGEILTLDLGAIGTYNVSVTLTTATGNHAPVITSNSGGASAAISVAENSLAVTTITATDVDAGQTLAYAILGGADASKFGINTQTGALAFLTAPDFETPADSGGNNVYDVTVSVGDGTGASDTQAIAVSVTNVVGVTVTGDSSANTLTGTSEADSLSGLAGNDLLIGGAGNDLLFGGLGFDAAQFSGVRSAYTITRNGTTLTVAGPDGIDSLTGVERLSFSDVLTKTAAPIVDFNGDGKSDLVWQNSQTGTIELLQMDGPGWTAYRDFSWGTQWRAWTAAGDFNGDGKHDMVWKNTQTGAVEVMLMDGVNPGAYRDYAWSSWNVVSASGDFNGDGKSDLVWQNANTGTVEVLLMDGVNSTSYRDYSWGTQWRVLSASGDFNGDGKSDLVWQNTQTGTVEVMLMNGVNDGAYRDYAWSSQWTVLSASGDFNGDGKSDLLWQNVTTGTVEVLLMDGANRTSYRDYSWGTQWRALTAAGDFNGDGKSDLVWQNTQTGTVEVMLMDGVNGTAFRDYALGPHAQVISAASDINGDGKSDLVWLNTDTNTVQVLQMDGINATTALNFAWSPQWHVIDAYPENVIV